MKRAPRPSLLLWLAAVTSAAVLGCGLNQEGVRPHPEIISYPASAVTDVTGEWLFVANSNADLRYNDGTLVALRLSRAAEDRSNRGAFQTCPRVNYVRPLAESPDFCCIDPLDPYILNCDERRYVEAGSSVRIGSFAAGMVRQDPPCSINPEDLDDKCQTCAGTASQGTSRLLIAVRGNTSLTYVDVKPEIRDADGNVVEPLVFDCVGDPTDGKNVDASGRVDEFTSCDQGHSIVETESALALSSPDPDPPLVRVPDEPYALAVDEDNGLLYVGHLAGATNRPGSGGVSLFDVAAVNDVMKPPRFIASFPVFAPNPSGLVGVTSLRWERGRPMFATSRYLPMVTGLASTTSLGCPLRKGDMEPIREIAVFGSGDSFGTSLTGSETRGIQFVKSMAGTDVVEHAFVLQRVPPAVVDFYQGIPSQVLEVCQSPTFLQKNNAGDRLFVNCFDSGEVYVIDPFVPRVERIFTVGRGPASLVFPENDPTVAYVVGFSDNNISVVDIAPGSASQYHVVQRIGFANSVPR